jgi:membrane protein DedA with SNARE-associated domain
MADGSFALGIPFGTLILCGLGLPLPEDIVLFASGFAGARAGFSVAHVAAIMYFGILAGDTATYCLGRYFGRTALESRFGRFVFPTERKEKAENMFHKYGNWVIFVGRFLPGLRAPIFFTAGTMRYSIFKFLFMDGFAALVSAPLFVWFGHWAASKYASDSGELEKILGQSKMVVLGAAVAGIIVLWLFLKFRKKQE